MDFRPPRFILTKRIIVNDHREQARSYKGRAVLTSQAQKTRLKRRVLFIG
ncbi:hypothetical protein ACVWYU_001160 [Pseudomonas sp. TE12234]|jgi:hypothetical protein|uniref:Uncharacterized protein n=1 Tax=Pseudomonas moorei TaxID=395599 RepID=A0A1H1E3Q8_9PSED|nr:hypothetical protein SAMN04490195_2013 [Pseudomonas moorei]